MPVRHWSVVIARSDAGIVISASRPIRSWSTGFSSQPFAHGKQLSNLQLSSSRKRRKKSSLTVAFADSVLLSVVMFPVEISSSELLYW